MCRLVVFFFKQKTAYEMRISDWSSDVCSSDLVILRPAVGVDAVVEDLAVLEAQVVPVKQAAALVAVEDAQVHAPMQRDRHAHGQGGGAVDHWLELAGQQRVQGRLGAHAGRVVEVAGGDAQVSPVQRRVERQESGVEGKRGAEIGRAHV